MYSDSESDTDNSLNSITAHMLENDYNVTMMFQTNKNNLIFKKLDLSKIVRKRYDVKGIKFVIIQNFQIY